MLDLKLLGGKEEDNAAADFIWWREKAWHEIGLHTTKSHIPLLRPIFLVPSTGYPNHCVHNTDPEIGLKFYKISIKQTTVFIPSLNIMQIYNYSIHTNSLNMMHIEVLMSSEFLVWY